MTITNDKLDVTDTAGLMRDSFLTARQERMDIIAGIYTDLIKAAIGLGQTRTQARAKVETLFRTFVAEVSLFTLIGADDLALAITNDATIGWLDTDISGTSIRVLLVNRLS